MRQADFTGMKNSRHPVSVYEQREKDRTKKNKGIWRDGANQRASLKQNQIVDLFCELIETPVKVDEPDLCRKELSFPAFRNLTGVHLGYLTQNTVWTRIFDLIVKTDVLSIYTDSRDYEQCKLIVGIKFKGNLKIKDIVFVPITNNSSTKYLIEMLNSNRLIRDLGTALEVTDLKIEYDSADSKWNIGFATGKGSTVWMLLPPVVNQVPFTKMDAIHSIELLQMIAVTIKIFEKEYWNGER